MKSLLLLIALFLNILLIVPITGLTTVSYVSFDSANANVKSNSLLGGADLYIKGDGLPSSASLIEVFVNGIQCKVNLQLTLMPQFACTVPASPTYGQVPVTVKVSGTLITCPQSICYITYDKGSTPVLKYLVPNTVTPNNPIKLGGQFRVSQTSLLQVGLGQFFCDFDLYGNQNIGYPNYLSFVKCQIDSSVVAGAYSVKMNAKTKGLSLISETAQVIPDQTYQSFAFLVAPEITQLSSNSGPSSGEEITITGRGFSTIPSQNVISFEGHPCTVISSTYSSIKCSLVSPPMPTLNTPRAGHAGLIQRIFSAKGTIDELKNSVDFLNSGGSINRLLTFETPYDDRDDYSEALEGLFKAPVTGSYKFLVSARGPAQLYISTTPLSKANLVKIAEVRSASNFRDFFNPSESSQVSASIALEGGKYYFLQALHLAQGAEHLTVGVKIPNTDGQRNTFSPKEVVSVRLKAEIDRLETVLTIRKSTDELKIYRMVGTTLLKSTTKFVYPANAQSITAALNEVGIQAQIVSQSFLNTDKIVAVAFADRVQYRFKFFTTPDFSPMPGLSKVNLGGFVQAPDNNPSPLVSGSYELKMGTQTISLNFDSTDQAIEEAFNDALGIKFATRVYRYGRPEEGCRFVIYFDANQDIPDIVLSNNLLTGGKSGVTLEIKLLQDAVADDFLISPIPSNLLYTFERDPQITVRTNGVLAACSGNCKYQPVTVTTCKTITGFTFSGSTLEIEFINVADKTLQDFTAVTFGGNTLTGPTSCSFDQTTQKLKCNIPLNPDGSPKIVAGAHTPTVTISGSGYACVAREVSPLTLYPQVFELRAQELAEGFLEFTVIGARFGFKICTCSTFTTKVMIGDVPCKLQALNNTVLTCRATLAITNGPFSVTVNGLTADIPYHFENAEVSADLTGDCYIDLIGTGFTTKTFVKLQNDKTGYLERCRSCFKNSTVIRCTTCGLPPGDYTAILTTPLSLTEAWKGTTPFKVYFEVNSVEPKFGSVLGGTVLTLKGRGFSETLNKNQVSLGCKNGCKNLRCNVLEASRDELKCKIVPNSEGLTGTQEVQAIIGLEFYANNLGDNTFTFSDDYTPTIVSVSNLKIKDGDQLTFKGTLFTSSTQIMFDGVVADIVQLVSNSEIIVRVPDLNAKQSILLTVTDPLYGDFIVPKSMVFNSPLTLTNLSPKIGSIGGTYITLTGSGFSNEVKVSVGSQACQVTHVTPTEITCKTPINANGAVTVTQGTFLNIGCNGCTYQSAASSTPVATSVNINIATGLVTITLQGSQLNVKTPILVNLVSDAVIQPADIKTSTASTITAEIPTPIPGSYQLEVILGGLLVNYQNSPSLKVDIPFAQPAVIVATTQVSQAGGADLTLQFDSVVLPQDPELINVKLAGFDCPVTYIGTDYAVCSIPPLIVPTVPALGQEKLLTGTVIASQGSSNSNFAFDDDTSTSFIGPIDNCFIGIDVGRDLFAEIAQIQLYPKIGIDPSRLQKGVFEGSNDGTNYFVFSTLDDAIYEGFNTIFFAKGSRATYRYIRFRQNNAASRCEIAELKFRGTLYSSMPTPDPTIVSVAKAIVTINKLTRDTITANVQYRKDITPQVSAISPKIGTSAGGTLVTITGSNLCTGIEKAQVYIDKTPCTIVSATLTKITCTTVALPEVKDRTERLNGVVTIKIKDKGFALLAKNANFLYAERWSESKTWGCDGPPVSGDSVHVPIGMNLFVDINMPRLVAVVVEGGLIFDDWDIDLHLEYLMIRNGLLRIGTEDQPITSQINITLHGNRGDAQLPIFGSKAIAVYEGVVDIHGTERAVVDTRLVSTANAGDKVIYVENANSFNVGEEIAISSTSNDPTQNEKRTILQKEGNKLTLDAPLQYPHLSGTESFDFGDSTPKVVEIKAIVALLTRNIVIKGDEESEDDKFGGHLLFFDPGTQNTVVRISYAEIKNVGQAGYVERHPINFQNAGSQMGSYIIGCSIHSSYHRGIQIRGTQYLTVSKNVLFDIENEGIILVDGSEKFNVIENNVIIHVVASLFRFNSYRSSSAIRLSNPLNFVTGNKIAGVCCNAFTLSYYSRSQGSTGGRSICPQGERLGSFEDNSVLSVGSVGLFIDSHFPRTFACQAYRNYELNPFNVNPPVSAIYKKFFAARTNIGVQAWYFGSVELDSFLVADSRYGAIEVRHAIYAPINSTQVKNSVVIGNLQIGEGSLALSQYFGVLVPSSDGFTVDNVIFANFDSSSPALMGCSNCANPWETPGSRVTFVNGLQFYDVPKRTGFTAPFTHIFRDLDGSLTDLGNGGAVVYNLPHLRVPQCELNSDMFDGLVCNTETELKGINFWNILPDYLREKIMMISRVDKENVNSDYSSITYRYPRSGYSAPFATGYAYKIWVDINLDFDSLLIENSPFYISEDLPIALSFNYTEPRELFEISRKVYLGNSESIVETLEEDFDIFDQDNFGTKLFGDFYQNDDDDKKTLYFALTGNNVGPQPFYESSDVASAAITAYRCKNECPDPLASVATNERPWSDASQWPGGQLPKEGDYVIIKETDIVILDIDPPTLDTLEIRGELRFDDRRAVSVLEAKKIWVRGTLKIGTPENRYTNKAIIRLVGARADEPIVVNFAVDVGTKVLVVTGNLLLYGKQITNFVRLSEDADPGATFIKLAGDISGFKKDDQILLAPSSDKENESEVRTISDIDYIANTITLDSALLYYHNGNSNPVQTINSMEVDLRTEVLLLSRNIQIEGTSQDGLGARIVVTDEYSETTVKTGIIDMEYASLSFCGQAGTDRAGLTFELATNVPDGSQSLVKGSVFRQCVGYAVRFQKSVKIQFTDNTIFQASQYAIKFHGNNDQIKISSNVIVGVSAGGKVSVNDIGNFGAGIALFDETNTNIELTKNIVAGSSFVGYLLTAPACGQNSYFANVAHSGKFGYIAYGDQKQCISITNFIVYRTEYGIHSYYRINEIRVSSLVLIDNTVSLNLISSSDGSTNIAIFNSYFGAVDVNYCYPDALACSNKAAIGFNVFTSEARPDSYVFHRSTRNLVLGSSYTLDNNVFAYFDSDNIPLCSGNRILKFSNQATNYIPYVKVSRSNLLDSNKNALALFRPPLINDPNCGPEVQCTLVSNTLVKDADGSLIGTPSQPGALLPDNSGVIDRTKCSFNSKINGYVCQSSKFALLGFRSLDTDKSQIVLDPIKISSSNGFSNLINSHRNNNPRHPADTQKYVSIVQTETSYSLSFPRDMPVSIQFELQGETEDYVIVKMKYNTDRVLGITNTVTGTTINPCLATPSNSPVIKTTDSCGTYIFDRLAGTIEFKITGDSKCRLRVDQTNSLVTTIRYSISVDEFFEQGGVAPFIDKFAAVLGIPSIRIRVVQIYKGSTVIVAFIDAEAQGLGSKVEAEKELRGLAEKLEQAIKVGDMELYNAPVLDFSIQAAMAEVNANHDDHSVIAAITPQESSSNVMFYALVTVIPIAAVVLGGLVIYKLKKRSKRSRSVVKIAPQVIETPASGQVQERKGFAVSKTNSGESRNHLASNIASVDSLDLDDINMAKRKALNVNTKAESKLDTIPERTRRMSIEEKLEDVMS